MSDITQDFFREIGISKGMTVLDVGCGRGVTTEMLAEIVGSEGKVVGLDSNPRALNAALMQAKAKNLHHIEYLASDLMDVKLGDRKFDAIVGRRVLKYVSNPRQAIEQLANHLKPNGIMGFQEHDSTSVIDKENMPLHHEVNSWFWKLVESNGGNPTIGKEIWSIFNHDSISVRNIKPEAIVQTPENEVSLIPLLQNLSGLLVAKGIVTENELNAELIEKLESEKKQSNSIFIRELIFFVDAQKHGASRLA
ncbi:methyltransferase domain-containing protein [Pontibacter sp. G13]|uniref:methyltransferase domain-containing protein n=1 Tax=Pontibacter sp. G13 TaxID=3074898 RepID=UPI002889F010|nr:methyltransferase domain-containing protein [Pontibacter sp. G13]WNJ19506.1 methyltransferase domain-containing protein [Pontibacter sp. G13]